MAAVADITWTVNTSKGSLTVTKVHELKARANASVNKTLFSAADEIIVSDGAESYTQLSVAASRILGKKSTGNLAALTAAEVLALLFGSGGIANLKVGTFTGNGAADRNITMGFIPDLYWQWGDGAASSTMSCGVFMNGCINYLYFGVGTQGTIPVSTGHIQADGSDGVILDQTGATGGPSFNISGDNYKFIALKGS